jgi:hypothetical protein
MMICSWCGKRLEQIVGEPELEVYEVLSIPDNSFKSKVLGRYCKECFEELSREYRKSGRTIIEQ